ncbi:MAG: TrmH family RNA methyltransferase [bacterium]|nr:TrmH family RNA methyltransferase [bacterium]
MFILLYNLRSVYNTASIFRTADCVGKIKKIYLFGTTPLPKNKIDEYRKDFIKVSLGAEKNIEWEYVKNLSQVLKLISNFKQNGFKILSIEQNKNSIPYYKINQFIKSKDKIVLVLGSETKGISKSILKQSDYILEIPIRGLFLKNKFHPKNKCSGKESLNVSVAFGIVLYRLLYY